MTRLVSQKYGKHQVRVSKILRDPANPKRHDFVQADIDVELQGDFDASYTDADNSSIVATDSIRNTVYAMAKDDPWASIESLGVAITGHFLKQYAHVTTATARLREQIWSRLGDHDHAFSSAGDETPTAEVVQSRASGLAITSGLGDLMIAKTTESGFTNFVDDEYRTLADTEDRILATVLTASWTYADPKPGDDYPAMRSAIRAALLGTFGDHYSISVQQTLYLMGGAALAACPSIGEITLTMPNKHHLRFPLEKLGRENHNDVFHVTDEPRGFIHATVGR
ncbi:MAG: factor-independent urate hydroxylase [Planctomycetota bacterium]